METIVDGQKEQEVVYKCNKCSESFKRKHQFTYHVETFCGQKKFSCYSCKLRFSTTDKLRQHKQSKHNNQNQSTPHEQQQIVTLHKLDEIHNVVTSDSVYKPEVDEILERCLTDSLTEAATHLLTEAYITEHDTVEVITSDNTEIAVSPVTKAVGRKVYPPKRKSAGQGTSSSSNPNKKKQRKTSADNKNFEQPELQQPSSESNILEGYRIITTDNENELILEEQQHIEQTEQQEVIVHEEELLSNDEQEQQQLLTTEDEELIDFARYGARKIKVEVDGCFVDAIIVDDINNGDFTTMSLTEPTMSMTNSSSSVWTVPTSTSSNGQITVDIGSNTYGILTKDILTQGNITAMNKSDECVDDGENEIVILSGEGEDHQMMISSQDYIDQQSHQHIEFTDLSQSEMEETNTMPTSSLAKVTKLKIRKKPNPKNKSNNNNNNKSKSPSKNNTILQAQQNQKIEVTSSILTNSDAVSNSSELQVYHCLVCKVNFNFMHQYKWHIETDHGRKPFRCYACSARYATIDLLSDHVNNSCPKHNRKRKN